MGPLVHDVGTKTYALYALLPRPIGQNEEAAATKPMTSTIDGISTS